MLFFCACITRSLEWFMFIFSPWQNSAQDQKKHIGVNILWYAKTLCGFCFNNFIFLILGLFFLLGSKIKIDSNNYLLLELAYVPKHP